MAAAGEAIVLCVLCNQQPTNGLTSLTFSGGYQQQNYGGDQQGYGGQPSYGGQGGNYDQSNSFQQPNSYGGQPQQYGGDQGYQPGESTLGQDGGADGDRGWKGALAGGAACVCSLFSSTTVGPC